MYTVKEAAKRTDLTTHTVRYYARIGLVEADKDVGNGYHIFSSSDITRLSFIKNAKALGFTLDEIRTLLAQSTKGHSPCAMVREMVQTHLIQTEAKIKELTEMRNVMVEALKDWQGKPNLLPHGDSVCHLIESISDPSEIKEPNNGN